MLPRLVYRLGVQTATQESSIVPPQSTYRPTLSEKRSTFFVARRNGQSVSVSAQAAGVNRKTGYAWEKEAKQAHAEQAARRAVLAGKTEVATETLEIARSAETDARDKLKAYDLYADLQGLKEPTRTQNVNINATVPASTLDLIRSRTQARLAAREAQAIRASGQPAIDGRVVPPEESKAEALSPSPNISTGEEK